MFPSVFEWIWDLGHIIFMGIAWTVMLILLTGVIYVVSKTVADTYGRDAEYYDDLQNDQD